MKTGLIASLFTLITVLVFSPPILLAATATHSYDDLNQLTQTVYDTGAKVTTIVYTYDPAGNMLSFDVTADFLLGDVDDSEAVDLIDAVLCLQVTSGVPPTFPVNQGADIDGDSKISTVELIYILQKVAGLR